MVVETHTQFATVLFSSQMDLPILPNANQALKMTLATTDSEHPQHSAASAENTAGSGLFCRPQLSLMPSPVCCLSRLPGICIQKPPPVLITDKKRNDSSPGFLTSQSVLNLSMSINRH